MDWQLREAGSDDVGRLALVGAATFLETFAGLLDGNAIVAHCATEHSEQAYRSLLSKADSAAWLVEASDGHAPLGYALVTAPKLAQAQANDLELKRIYSFSRMHGSGAGAALMAGAIAHATTAGAARLLLGVFTGNRRAIAFYRRHGFGPIGERRFRIGTVDYEDIVLAKPLPAA